MQVLKMLLVVALVLLVSACAPAQPPLTEERPAPVVVPVDEAEGVDLRIEVEESFVATALVEQLGSEPLSVQPGIEIMLIDPVFSLIPDNAAQLTATFEADVFGNMVIIRPTVTLLLSAEDGAINVEIGGVGLGNVWFPLEAVEDELAGIENTVQELLAGVLQGLADEVGLQVKNLVIVDGALILDLGR
jgi:hypothetical protein